MESGEVPADRNAQQSRRRIAGIVVVGVKVAAVADDR